MNRQPAFIEIAKLSLNTQASPIQAEPTHLISAMNVYSGLNGTWATRCGFSSFTNEVSSSGCDGFLQGTLSGTSYTVKAEGGFFYVLQSTTWVLVPFPVGGALLQGIPVNMAIFQNFFVIGNGINRNLKFDGILLTFLTPSPADLEPAKYFMTHGSRLYAAGFAAFPSRLKWSTDNNVASWNDGTVNALKAVDIAAAASTSARAAALAAAPLLPVGELDRIAGEAGAKAAGDFIATLTEENAGFKDIEAGVNDIIGIASFDLALYVFKGPNAPSIHLLKGTSDDDFTYRPLFRGVTGFHRSIINTINDLFFMGPSGITSLNSLRTLATVEQAKISAPVQSLFTPFSGSLQHCFSVYLESLNLILFFFQASSAPENNSVLCYSYPSSHGGEARWSQWKLEKAVYAIPFTDSSGNQRILVSQSDGKTVISDFSKDTDATGTVFPSKISTPFLTFGNERILKGIRYVTLHSVERGATIGVRVTPAIGSGDYKLAVPDPSNLWNAVGAVWNAPAAVWPFLFVSSNGVSISGYFTRGSLSIEKVARGFEVKSLQIDYIGGGQSERDFS